MKVRFGRECFAVDGEEADETDIIQYSDIKKIVISRGNYLVLKLKNDGKYYNTANLPKEYYNELMERILCQESCYVETLT